MMNMSHEERSLGSEIRRLRFEVDVTLRSFAKKIGVSAAYLSDIEHNRRRPAEKVLRRIASELRVAGATYEMLAELDTRLDPEIRAWIAETPGVNAMLRTVRDSDRSLDDVIEQIEKSHRKRLKAKE